MQATKIQSAFRGHQARKDFQDKVFEVTWQELDVDDEKQAVYRDAACGNLQQQLDKGQPFAKRPRPGPIPRDPAPSDYDGPHLSSPLSVKDIQRMIQSFSDGKRLHATYACRIFNSFESLSRTLPTVVDIRIPEEGRLMVFGDLHGQLYDLLTILRLNGFPSETNYFLFNGDFVDRGPNGVEVLLILYALKLVFPRYVFMNRGNHEERRINERFGFEREVLRKYDPDMLDVIEGSFNALPLVHVIENKIIVMHGGLSSEPDVLLSELRAINRFDPQLLYKWDGSRQQKIVEGLLWSDPRNIQGFTESHRGAGVEFGADVTADFLRRNNLELLIRSHEMMEDGYERQHGDKLVTVFSASYYCGKNRNFGAFVSIVHNEGQLARSFHTFKSDVAEVGKLMSKQQIPVGDSYPEYNMTREEETLHKLRERIYVNRHRLLTWFSNMDVSKTGCVSRELWARGMVQCLNLPRVPWLSLLPHLARQNTDGSISYTRFAQRYQLRLSKGFCERWRKQMLEIICDRIFRQRQGLQEAFRQMDLDGDGTVTYVEFAAHMRTLGLGLNDNQLFDLMRGLGDIDGRGFSYESFISCFEPPFLRVAGKQLSPQQAPSDRDEDAFDPHAIVDNIRELINLHRPAIESYFMAKKDSIGQRSLSELFKLYLGPDLSHQQRYAVARMILAGKDRISWREFQAAFDVTEAAAGDWQEHVASVIYSSRVQLRRAFRFFDRDGGGTISRDEFKKGLEVLNVLEGFPLTDEHIAQLYDSIDRNGDGMVEFDEFLNSFEIIDTDPDSVPMEITSS